MTCVGMCQALNGEAGERVTTVRLGRKGPGSAKPPETPPPPCLQDIPLTRVHAGPDTGP